MKMNLCHASNRLNPGVRLKTTRSISTKWRGLFAALFAMSISSMSAQSGYIKLIGIHAWDTPPSSYNSVFAILNKANGSSGGPSFWANCSRNETTGYVSNYGDNCNYGPMYDDCVPAYVGKPLMKASYYDFRPAYNAQQYAILGQYTIMGDLYYWLGARYYAVGAFDLTADSDKVKQRARDRHRDSMVGDPVDAATGGQLFEKTLISVQGGLPIDFTLELNTRLNGGSVWGTGWGHSFQASLSTSATGATVNWTPNRMETFRRDATGAFLPMSEGTNAESLIANANGTYTLTTHEQARYLFSSTGVLQSIWRHGKFIDLTYGSHGLSQITDRTTGKYLAISYAFENATWLWVPTTITDGNGRQASLSCANWALNWVTDADGRKTTFAYSSAAKLVSATDVTSGTVLFTNTYDAVRRIVSQADPAGRATTFSYDLTTAPGNVITTVTNRDGGVRKFTHDFNLQLMKIVDETNAATTYAYDAAGNRTSATDALGRVTSFTYDTRGNLTSVTDPASAFTQLAYDASNNLTQITDDAGKTTSFTYDSNNNALSSTNAKAEVSTFTYNANGQITQKNYPGGGVEYFNYTGGFLTSTVDRANNTSTLTYDTAGRITSITDAAGKATSFLYDAMGNVLRTTLPGGAQWNWTYNWQDKKLTEKDPLNQTTTFEYNGNGELTKTTAPLSTVTQFNRTYEQAVSSVIDANNHVTQFGRDNVQRLTSIVDALNRTQQFTYDAVGNKTATFNAAATKVSEVIYNSRDLPATLKDAYGTATALQYDTRKRLTGKTDALSRATQFGYDDLHRMTSVQDPSAFLTGQGFDLDGNRNALTNAATAATGFQFDLAGRLTLATTATGKQTACTYNNRNLLSTITDANGQITTLTYSDPGALATATDSVGQISYGRDLKGRLLTVVENGKTITRAYDALDRLTDYTDGDGNHLHYTYDAVGNLLTLTYPDNKVVTYGYDALNRMTSVTDWASRVTTYSYDQAGRLAVTTRANGTVETRTYDLNDRLLSITDTDSSANVISSTTLARDSIGRITTEASAPVPWIPSGALASTYGYDSSDRLTSRNDTDGGSNSVMTRAIAFDNASNITSSNTNPLLVPGLVPESVAMTYDVDNRISSFNGPVTQFDNNGNLTSGPLGVSPPLSTLTYDARNRLTSAGGLSFGYDAENRRTSLTSSAGTIHYVFNPQPSLDQILLKTAPTGTVTRYVYGLGLIAEETGTDYRAYHYDSRGSTVALTDASGAVTGRASYGAYGEVVQKDAALTTSFLFNGQYGVQTDDNGLLYMRARYYSPLIKRFINQDTVLGSIDSSASLNRFAYANGNPASLIDPFGLCANEEGWRKGLRIVNAFLRLPKALFRSFTFDRDAMADILEAQLPPGAQMGVSSEETLDRYVHAVTTADGLAGIAGGLAVAGLIGEGEFAAGVTETRALGGLAEQLPRNLDVYQALYEAPIAGATRSAHRASANRYLANNLGENPDFAVMFNLQLGTDVLNHMQSGRGLLNPPGTVWHHPVNNPNTMYLLQAGEHTNPALQPVLHPNGIGGFGNFYGH
jgi:RHS repeat-associated protein